MTSGILGNKCSRRFDMSRVRLEDGPAALDRRADPEAAGPADSGQICQVTALRRT